jgi:hypothetical protein
LIAHSREKRARESQCCKEVKFVAERFKCVLECYGATKDKRSFIRIEETMHNEDIDTYIQGNPGSVSVRAKPG